MKNIFFKQLNSFLKKNRKIKKKWVKSLVDQVDNMLKSLNMLYSNLKVAIHSPESV